MHDQECVHFLQWALPKLQMQWKGFRKVRRQVCRRISKRCAELQLDNPVQYQEYLEQNIEEWRILDRMCCITISRFYRNRGVFDYLIHNVLPELILRARSEGRPALRVWSCGCASGEEPYTIALIWDILFSDCTPDLNLEIIATDIDPWMIARAQTACYNMSSLRNLPQDWLARAFFEHTGVYCLHPRLKKYVRYELRDVRETAPDKPFHIVLCRNLALTYFSPELQEKVLHTLENALVHEGILITGTHETIAHEQTCFVPLTTNMPLYKKRCEPIKER